VTVTYSFQLNSGFDSIEQSYANEIHYKPDPHLPAWRYSISWGGIGPAFTVSNSLTGPGALGPGWWLTVEAQVWDSTSRESSLIVHKLPMFLAERPTREEVQREILRLTIAIETHEVMENLKAGEARVWNPHGDGRVDYGLPSA
jgi:hypothetical protein